MLKYKPKYAKIRQNYRKLLEKSREISTLMNKLN